MKRKFLLPSLFKSHPGLGLSLTFLTLGATMESHGQGTELLVDSPTDIVDDDFSPGNLSLREAVAIANDTDADLISFDPGLDGATITLTGGELAITSSMTIRGPGADRLTISGGGNSRVFAEVGNGRRIITISDLTLADGNAPASTGGGAFFTNGGTVTFERVVMTNNNSQGNNGSTIIAAFGTLKIDSCAIVGNLDTGVGAIRLQDNKTTITNSTIANNLTRAISFVSASANADDSLSLCNVTVIGNSSSALEIVALGGNMVFEYQNSIFAENVGTNLDARGNQLEGLTITSLGNNLLDDSPVDDASHPAAESDRRDTDPLLAPLGNYGGPSPTSPPLPGSPAIEGGATVGELPVDQRGSDRVSGAFPDIGSVEAFPFALLAEPVDTDGDGIDDRVETGLFGNTSTANATSDSDGDGSTDQEEVANMTNPLDAGDVFRILAIRPAPGFVANSSPLFEVTIKTFPGLDYSLELSETAEFTALPETARTIEIAETGGFSETVEIELRADRDFLRAKRN